MAFQDLVEKYKQKLTGYFDPSSNGGNNFWSSPIAQGMAKVQPLGQPLADLYKEGAPAVQRLSEYTNPVSQIAGRVMGKAPEKPHAGDIPKAMKLGLTGAGMVLNPGSALFAGGIGGTFQGISNLAQRKPITQDLPQSMGQGVNFGAMLSPIGEVASAVAPQLPIVSKFASGKLGNIGRGVAKETLTGLGYGAATGQNPLKTAVEFAPYGLMGGQPKPGMAGVETIRMPEEDKRAISGLADFFSKGGKKNPQALKQAKADLEIYIDRYLGKGWVDKNGVNYKKATQALMDKAVQGYSQAYKTVWGFAEEPATKEVTGSLGKTNPESTKIVTPLQTSLLEPPPTQTTRVSSPESIASMSKMRGFPQTVLEDAKVVPEVKQAIKANPQNFYEPLKNTQVLNQVNKIIKRGEAAAVSYAKTGTDTTANATAMVMIDKYLKQGKFDQANELIAAVSPRFTDQGQQIQILSLYSRLTPAGATKYAQKIIDQANARTGGKLKLTPEATKEIVTKAEALQKLPEGSRERLVATAQLMDSIAAQVPPSLGQKIAAIQTMAQLLNPKTAIRNTLGNTLFAGAENVSDVVGTGVDKVVGMITGKRTKVIPSLGAQYEGAKSGFKLGFEDALKGIDTSGGVNSQFDLPNRTFRTGFLSQVEKALNIELRATDRAAYTAAYEGSLNNQMRAAGVSQPTPEMMSVAHADGLYRTFQDNSKLAQMFAGGKKLLNKVGTPDGKFGLGDLILKYPKTPANILSRGLDYSPAGFAKAIYEATRPILGGMDFNQKAFVESLSRSMVGTGIIAAGYVLAKNGIITGKPEKDRDIAAAQRLIGQGGFKLNVDALKRFVMSGGKPQQNQEGDTLVSYDWAQPNALQLSMGANTALGVKGSDAFTELVNSFETGTQTLTQQPLVKGVTSYASDIKDYGPVTATTKAALGSASGFVPSLLNQIGQLTDNTSRETYDPNQLTQAKNQILARLPIARETLPPKIGVNGQPLESYQNGSNNLFNVFFNPAFVSTIKSDPVANEVLRIFENTGETQQAPWNAPKSVKVNGTTIKLSPDQFTQYQTYIGQKANTGLLQLMSQPDFQSLSDEEKAKKMANLLSDINSAAKIELFGNAPKTTSSAVKDILNGGVGLPAVSVKSAKPKKISVKKLSSRTIKLSVPKARKVSKVPKIKKLAYRRVKINPKIKVSRLGS